MPDGENSAMNAVQTACADAAQAGSLADACVFQLFARDEAVLPRRDPRDRCIRTVVGEFPTHVGG